MPVALDSKPLSIRFGGEELVGREESFLRDVRGDKIAMIFQEPMTSLNPLHTVEKQINETLLLHKGMTGEAARRRFTTSMASHTPSAASSEPSR